MNEGKYVIDRIEAGIAVCECLNGGGIVNIAVDCIFGAAKEGDVIRKDGDSYVVDGVLTEQRRKMLACKIDSLFRRSPPLP